MNRMLFALAVSLVHCVPAEPRSDAALDASTYTLALTGVDPAALDASSDGVAIDLRMGFQGFRYTRVVLVASGDAPAVTPARATLDIDGFDRAEQLSSQIELRPTSDGRRVSAPWMIFANDVDPARAVGRRARLEVTLDDRERRANAVLEGVVRWDPTCVEGPDFRCQSIVDGGGYDP